MAASEYVKWIKVANDLGLGGDELKTFVKERQEEAKLEKARADEAEREARKMGLEGKRLLAEAESRRIAAEQETKKLEFEEKKQIAEREAENRRMEAEMKKLEIEARKQEMESQQIIRLKEMEFRLAQEQGNAERQNIIGQGDSRSDHR